MAPLLKPRQGLNKERFSSYFEPLKSVSYHDPASNRGAQSHNIRSIDWNPLGNLIATGAADKTLRVWNPEKPNARFSTELKGHAAPIEKVAFNPVKDAELCSVSNDGVVKFWDVRTKACVNEIKGLGDAFTLVWHPDGESIIVGNKADNVFILDPTSPTPRASFQQPVQTNQIAFDWAGEVIFVTTGDGRVRILDYPTLQPAYHLPYGADEEGRFPEFFLDGHTSSALSVALSPAAKYLATGGSDSIISLWDTSNWICPRTLTNMVGAVRSLSFTFDGAYIVGGSDEGTGLEVNHVETGEHVHTFKTASPSPVVSWAPTRYCLAYSDIGMLRIVGVDPDRK
ncbi:Tho complex subunit 3 [Pleurostoma richardsiae]|uniref:Tho complex subunit 3 n=1 Tax=Pleurostoma richardsiae TaxID=41990 RepID=A0AA38RUG6_9PEZI|nr:Tho complex subunit 3 [Pleurostoma richardsiae]